MLGGAWFIVGVSVSLLWLVLLLFFFFPLRLSSSSTAKACLLGIPFTLSSSSPSHSPSSLSVSLLLFCPLYALLHASKPTSVPPHPALPPPQQQQQKSRKGGRERRNLTPSSSALPVLGPRFAQLLVCKRGMEESGWADGKTRGERGGRVCGPLLLFLFLVRTHTHTASSLSLPPLHSLLWQQCTHLCTSRVRAFGVCGARVDTPTAVR